MIFSKKTAHSHDKIDALRLINDDTPFAINEAFRALYTKVIYLPIIDKCKKIAVTSSVSGEGKTYLATNLAISLAKNSDNKKIVLIDLDMRKPRISRVLSKHLNKTKSRNGMSEYLAGIDSEPNVISTDVPNLSVILAGKENANALGLVTSVRMSELLEKLSLEFVYIIFDKIFFISPKRTLQFDYFFTFFHFFTFHCEKTFLNIVLFKQILKISFLKHFGN